MRWQSPEDAMPWVGLYISGASLICTLAMAADAFQGFRQWRLWFPCRLFTINAVSITLIAIAMKLPVDLTTKVHGDADVQAKYYGLYFLSTMLANFLPSLGLMHDKELVTNMIAFGILLITITVNVLIQSSTGAVYDLVTTINVLIFPILLLFSVTLIVPTFRRFLQHRYKELHVLDSAHQEVIYSYKELTCQVKKSWMTTETGNPQFVIACSHVSYVFGLLCAMNAVFSVFTLIQVCNGYADMDSDYEWSIVVILVVQALGVVIGSIAPIFRCFTAISHFDISERWSMKQVNVFKVEKYWTERLHLWRRIHVGPHIYIPGRYLKIVLNGFKNMILYLCIALQITFVVIGKTISLVPKCFLILLSCCCSWCITFLKRCIKGKNASESNVISSEIKEYKAYVVRFEDESQLSERLLRNALNSITKLIRKSEKKQHSNLVKLLKKATRFNEVLEFDQVPRLLLEENQSSWSLVAVTLTAIAIALPSIEKSDIHKLLASMREGLEFISHVEENLNSNTDDLKKARKVARRLWTEVEVCNKWLQIKLKNNARNKKTPTETLQWLGKEAVEVEEKLKSCKNQSVDDSVHKSIAASYMDRISETILHHCNDNDQQKVAFHRIETLIADILCDCFTNIPRVIKMMCHHNAVEKREDKIRAAAQLLGKSKLILEILEPPKLPDIDQHSMA